MPPATPADPHEAEALDALRAEVAALRAVVETLVEKLDGGGTTAGAVSVEEAGKLLGCSRRTVYELIKAEDLRPVKLRGRTKVPTTQIRALLRRGTSP